LKICTFALFEERAARHEVDLVDEDRSDRRFSAEMIAESSE